MIAEIEKIEAKDDYLRRKLKGQGFHFEITSLSSSIGPWTLQVF